MNILGKRELWFELRRPRGRVKRSKDVVKKYFELVEDAKIWIHADRGL